MKIECCVCGEGEILNSLYNTETGEIYFYACDDHFDGIMSKYERTTDGYRLKQ